MLSALLCGIFSLLQQQKKEDKVIYFAMKTKSYFVKKLRESSIGMFKNVLLTICSNFSAV